MYLSSKNIPSCGFLTERAFFQPRCKYFMFNKNSPFSAIVRKNFINASNAFSATIYRN